MLAEQANSQQLAFDASGGDVVQRSAIMRVRKPLGEQLDIASPGKQLDIASRGAVGSDDSASAHATLGVVSPAAVQAMRRAGASYSLKSPVKSIGVEDAVPDGRECTLCISSDMHKDPVHGRFRKWFRTTKDGRHNDGSVCWYCGRAWQSALKARYKTLTILISAIGVDDGSLKEELGKVVEFLIQKCIAAGCHDIYVSFNDIPTTVTSKHRERQAVFDDDDQHVELEYYKKHFQGGMGDPFQNGLGHKVGTFDGIWGVFVPGAPVKRIRRSKEAIVDKHQVHDDGKVQLSETQMSDTAASIFAGFRIASATGTHLGLLAAPASGVVAATAAGAASGPPSATAAAAAAPSLPADGPSSGGFFNISFATAPQAPTRTMDDDTSGTAVATSDVTGVSRRPGGKAKAKGKANAKGAPGQQSPQLARSGGGGAGGTTPPSFAKGKKGRPKRHLLLDAEKVAGDFQQATSSDQAFFGTGARAQIQWLTRLIDCFTDRIEELSQDAEATSDYAEHVRMKKVPIAIRSMCKEAQKTGVESEPFLDCCYSQLRFLEMEPVVQTNVFPTFIRTSANKMVIDRTEPGPEFWRLISPTALGSDDQLRLMDIKAMQREHLENKVVTLQEDPKTFLAQMDRLLDADDMKLAKLPEDLYGECCTLQEIILCCQEPIGSFGKKQLTDALAQAQDKSKTVVHSLFMFPCGRQVFKDAQGLVDRMDMSDKAVDSFERALGQMQTFQPLLSRSWDGEAVSPASGALDSLKASWISLTDADRNRADKQVMQRIQVANDEIDAWTHFLLASSHQFLLDMVKVDSWSWDGRRASSFERICTSILSFEGVPVNEDDSNCFPALKQMVLLFEFVSKALGIAGKDRFSFEEGQFLQTNMSKFAMDYYWAEVVSSAHVAEQQDSPSSANGGACPIPGIAEAIAFQRALQSKFYSCTVQKHIFEQVCAAHGLQNQLKEFAASVPAGFKAEPPSVPDSFAELGGQELLHKLAVVNDEKLISQMNYIMAFHSMLKAAGALPAHRGDGCKIGVATGSMLPVSEDITQLLSNLRKCIVEAHGMQKASESISRFTADDIGLHLNDLDGMLDEKVFGSFALQEVNAELGIWRQSWALRCAEFSKTITEGSLPGWAMEKDMLLHQGREELQQKLLNNAKYLEVSEAVVALGTLLGEVKKMQQDSCGMFLPAQIQASAKSCLGEGYELVSITYALYNVLQVIPSIKTLKDRKKAVETLRASLKTKGVALGESLDQQCTRLSSMDQDAQ